MDTAYRILLEPDVQTGFIDTNDSDERHQQREVEFWRPFCVFGPELAAGVLEAGPETMDVILTGDQRRPRQSVMGVLWGWVIDGQFRDVIENLEPDTHLFRTVETSVRGSGEPYGTYHILRNANFVDCIDIERTQWGDNNFGRAAFEEWPTFGNHISIKSEAVAGLHLWRGLKPFYSEYFCSGEFKAACEQAGIRGLWFMECKLVQAETVAAE